MAQHRLLFVLVTAASLPLAIACGKVVSDDADTASKGADASAANPLPDDVPSTSAQAPVEAGATYASPTGGRATATPCTRARPAGRSFDASAGGCSTDSDCTAGDAGRCVQLLYASAYGSTTCSYDACTQDTDCSGDHAVCGCGANLAGANTCFANSNCRVDADCTVGQRCVLSTTDPATGYGVVDGGESWTDLDHPPLKFEVGYFCTTRVDECTLPHASLGSGEITCVYSPTVEHWVWVQIGP